MIKTNYYIISFLFLFAGLITKGSDINVENDTSVTKDYYYEYGFGLSMIGFFANANMGMNVNQTSSFCFQLSGSYEIPILYKIKNSTFTGEIYPHHFFLSSVLLYNLNYKSIKLGAGLSYSYGRRRTDEFLYSGGNIISNDEYYRYIKYHVIGGRINLQYPSPSKRKTWSINIFCDLNPQHIQYGLYFSRIIQYRDKK